ncbi:uncharacterized protein LOC105213550 isoform X1 [Zeugodacus cucurbitae]|uniref:uncharacterized protein LOC105213550 isoform X1 n=2 Tax=Zeugodacus cucurbitae TaxID=28588 RepID=UPI0005968A68|nr:uncharacterized protein LOC105213550 isoform X1 [Zeugodacus cucurbitae]XP_011184759.1 uncharacterized protein LOC105213550 isoform X1 [Zeugodacus cucurbitae]XP_028897030.1 uncharacterized protein LOC105213550 isoform X1 [Zeugodacus cucurbitae]XP_054083261.1 uncharacterized protein LOC105213550 isoform X1 [Zeugodacus cucurbitae]XP_054083273.1 uncharacterized protein LOC105213550 isoform X1 [Zeugodacus cucurbitae]
MHVYTHTNKQTIRHTYSGCAAQMTVSTEMPKSSTPPPAAPAAQLRLSICSQRQPFKRLLATVLLLCCLQLLHINCHALLLKCPLYQMRLQKIVGFRPPLEYLTAQNLIYSPAYNFKDRNRHRRESYSIIGATDGQSHELAIASETASAICWRLCNEDSDCIAYVHLLDSNECYGYSYIERQPRYQAIANELPLVADAEAVFYEKTCLKVPEVCKQRKWTLTKIPGTSLVFQGKKTIATLVTRRECAERCLFESEFKCLSASFAPSYRNNRERFSQHVPPEQHASNNQQQQQYQQQSQHNTLGRCILSDKDKMIQPDAFRAAPYDEEYMENQCYERPIENDNCSYELYANSSFIYAEAKYLGLTQKECQAYCSHETKFYCQGVSFYFEHDLSNSECLLHSEDIISMGPRSLKLREKSVYMRRVKCLDVQVLCTQDEMAIKYTPKDWFHGKMYVSMHSKHCMAQGNGTRSTVLRLPIGTEVKENRCGILRAYEVTKAYQRIFISALVVIQNNPNVQTQGDRLIKVGCIMSNSTMRKDGHNEGRSDEDEVEGEDVPNAIALESSLEFAQHMLPNEGSLLFNSTDVPLLPKVTLQIVDLSHQHETNDVQIGQNLELQIIAEYSPHQQQLVNYALPPLPDFRATSLFAKTQDNQNFVKLIDERGCPIDVTVFPALERVRSTTQNKLRARFHAFKFAGSSLVNFDVKIRFCMQHCPEDNCYRYDSNEERENFSNTPNNRVRRRRQVQARAPPPPPQAQEPQTPLSTRFQVQNPVYVSTVMDVAEDQLEQMNLTRGMNEKNMSMQDLGVLPLNYNLHVRGPDQVNSNSFIYGERGILLIAGIDHMQLDNFCLNQSLLIALLIFWLIFQVALMFSCCYVIQKYKRLAMMDDEHRKIKESLDYLESRRVHWADQGGYTL